MALSRRAALPRLLVAAALLACVARGAQLPTIDIAGELSTYLAADPTVMFTGQLALSVKLPHTITSMAMDPNTGVLYIGCAKWLAALNDFAGAVIAATPTGTGAFTLKTVAGNYAVSASTDGTGTSASFKRIDSVTVDGCVSLRFSSSALVPDQVLSRGTQERKRIRPRSRGRQHPEADAQRRLVCCEHHSLWLWLQQCDDVCHEQWHALPG